MNALEVLNYTIFITVGGSKAYGTSTPESDIDIRGVCLLPDKSYYFGLVNKFEQAQAPKEWSSQNDITIYDFRKALTLIAAGNPNMVELVFPNPLLYLQISPSWERIIEHRDLFLSKKMRQTYGGYAFAQLKRIRRHRSYLLNPPKKKPERTDFGLHEYAKHISNDEMASFQHLIAILLREKIQLMDFSEQTKQELQAVSLSGFLSNEKLDQHSDAILKLTGAHENYIEVFMRERAYAHATRQWEAYQRWNNERNPKRKAIEARFGYDTKHAMHLVRLLRMAIEILRDKKVNVWREDHEELLAIRNGAWSYEQLEEFAEQTDKQLTELNKISSLPKAPDMEKIDKLCIETIERFVCR